MISSHGSAFWVSSSLTFSIILSLGSRFSEFFQIMCRKFFMYFATCRRLACPIACTRGCTCIFPCLRLRRGGGNSPSSDPNCVVTSLFTPRNYQEGLPNPFLQSGRLCLTPTKTDPAVLVSFISTRHKLESLEKKEPQLRKCFPKIQLQASQ